MLSNILLPSLFQVSINNCLATAGFDTWAERRWYCD